MKPASQLRSLAENLFICSLFFVHVYACFCGRATQFSFLVHALHPFCGQMSTSPCLVRICSFFCGQTPGHQYLAPHKQLLKNKKASQARYNLTRFVGFCTTAFQYSVVRQVYGKTACQRLILLLIEEIYLN